jgi:alpha-N-acetylglucosaminidase
MFSLTRLSSILLAVSLSLCGMAKGGLIARESFDYTAGSVSPADGGAGWDGAWRDNTGAAAAITVASGLAQGNLTTNGGAMTVGSTSTTRFRLLSPASVTAIQQQQAGAGELWLGFVGRNTGASGKGFQVTQMTGYTDTAANRRILMGTNLFTGNGWSWTNETTIGNGNLSGIDTTNQVFYVIKFKFNSATSSSTTMYLFNTSVTDVTNLANATYVSATGTNNDASRQPVFDRLRVSSQNLAIDEIRIGTSFADIASYSPAPVAPGITSHPTAVAATEFGSATFSVQATGTQPLAYQWKKGTEDLIGKTAATLTLSGLSATDAGDYSVTVTNSEGSVTSNTATLSVAPYNRDISAAAGLLGRILPAYSSQFTTAFVAPENGMDVFEIESSGDKIVLRGNTPVSIASALNHYLKNICRCHVSRNGDQLSLPAPLPLVPAKIRVVSPHRVRFFYNPCTFGYTSAWWDWDKWEREIDHLAMDGVNVAQVTPGTEKVFLNTLRDHFGYTDLEVRTWLCMPTHLPWMLLSNMHSFGGPVPSALIESRATLGRQICDRMRSLGMSPMVQGFYGMVPQDFKARDPATDVRTQGTWAGGFQRPNMLNPTDPVFDTFTTHYATALNDVFGPVNYYAADPFHEGGDTTGINLTTASQSILAGISKANPQATWVIEAWGGNPIQAMLDAVDKNRLLVLDLNCTTSEGWRSRASFNNTPWVWCAIQNFGGNTGMISKLGTLASRPAAAFADPAKGPMAGIGAVPEGTHTIPAAYDMLFSHSWSSTAPTLTPWVRDYTRRRYGKSLPAIDDAWEILLETALDLTASIEEPHNSIITARPGLSTNLKARTWSTTNIPYDASRFAEAWGKLLEASPEAGLSDAYRFDVADVARQTLCDLATRHQRALAAAVTANNAAAVHLHGDRILEIIADLDILCASRREWLLGSWIEDARSWGTTPAEQDLCELAARRLLTTWNASVSDLNDYANREWAGLLGGFHLPRWQQFITALYAAVDAGQSFNETSVRSQIGAWELTWANGHEAHTTTPVGDSIAIAQSLWAKYGNEAVNGFSSTTLPVGATWTPAICSTSPVRWTRDVTSIINQTGVWVAHFQYTSGSNALQISRAAVDDGTNTLDLDKHPGWTGIINFDNRYYLRVPTLPSVLNFTATVNSAGGTDSNGTLTFTRCPELTVGNTWAPADCAIARQIWNRDVTATVNQTGVYQLTLTRTGGSANLTVDRAWLEQNGATIAAEVRDETLTSATTNQSWTLTVDEIAATPVTLRLATGSSAAAGSSGTITLIRTGSLPQPAPNPVNWAAWSAANNANPSALFEFLQGTTATSNPLGIVSGNQLHFKFAPNRTGVALGLESSSDLTSWQADTTATFLGETTLTPTESKRTWLFPATESHRFYRLKATPSTP